jgi:hypothetical protein
MGQVEVQLQPQATLAATKAKGAGPPWRLAKPMRGAAGVPVALRALIGALVAGLLAAAAVLTAGAPSAAAATRTFAAADLGTFGGCCNSAATLNDRGLVVGEADSPGGAVHAVLWTPFSG